MPTPNVGTPDWQSGVVSAQSLLNTVATGVTSVVVNVPLNAEALLIISNYADDPPPQITVSGTGPFLEWPVYPLPPNFGTQTVAYMCPVSAALTPQVQVVWGTAPLQPWYVVSDAGGRLTIDATLAGALGIIGNSVPSIGLVTVGSDGAYAHPFSTDSNGRQIPLVPTHTTNVLGVSTTNAIILSGPVTGGFYLMSCDFRNDSGASIVLQIADAAAVAISNVRVPVGDSRSVDLKGYRIAADLYCIASALNGFVTVRYAAGP